MFCCMPSKQYIVFGQVFLLLSDKTDESLEVADFALIFLRETGNVLVGNDERQARVMHLFQLVFGDSLLEREEIFHIHTVGLGQYLPPSVFAGGLCAKHYQIVSWELHIVIALAVGKQEVRFLVVFCDGLLLKHKLVMCKNVG